jgi:hypothetical protein
LELGQEPEGQNQYSASINKESGKADKPLDIEMAGHYRFS